MNSTLNRRFSLALALLGTVCAVCLLLLSALRPGIRGDIPELTDRIVPQIRHTAEQRDDAPAGVVWHYTFDLPDSLGNGMRIAFRSNRMYTEVRIGTETVFLTEPVSRTLRLRSPGSYWVLVPLTQDQAGLSVEITVTPLVTNVGEPNIRIGTPENLLRLLFPTNLSVIYLSTVVGFEGLILMIIAVFTPFERRARIGLMFLALLAMFSWMWKTTSLPLLSLFLSQSAQTVEALSFRTRLISMISVLSLLVMPLMAMRFLDCQERDGDIRGSFWFSAAAVAFIILCILQISGLAELIVMLPCYLALNVILETLNVVKLTLAHRGNVWYGVFPLAVLLDLIVYFVTGTSQAAIFVLLCVVIVSFGRGVRFMQMTIERTRELQNTKAAILVSQIRPHFIHNTLASVYYLCDSDPEQAKQVILDFSSYLQSNFTNITKNDPIPFEEELIHTKAYVSVEMIRFKGKLDVEYDTPHMSFRLPALTLQPIVENSVRYGVGRGRYPEHIVIRTRSIHGGSEITVEDNGIGYDPVPDGRPHVGLRNIRERLELMNHGTLTIVRLPEGGTRVAIFIPDIHQDIKDDTDESTGN